MNTAESLTVWKKIKVGAGAKNKWDLLGECRYPKAIIDDWVREIVTHPHFVISEVEFEIDLVLLDKQRDFGDSIHSKYGALRHGESLGLKLCPEETALQLCLEYPDQPHSEVIEVASRRMSAVGTDGRFRLSLHDFILRLRTSPVEGFDKRRMSYSTLGDSFGGGDSFYNSRKMLFVAPSSSYDLLDAHLQEKRRAARDKYCADCEMLRTNCDCEKYAERRREIEEAARQRRISRMPQRRECLHITFGPLAKEYLNRHE